MTLTALAVVAAIVWWSARGRTTSPGPIVLISIDTLRADHLPAYGYTKVKTPAIDALARDGVLFEHAYAHAPQTLPSHASILSGLLPFEHGVRDNLGFAVRSGQRLVSQMLRERGFTTAGVVSAYVLRTETGMSQGFDLYDSQMPAASPEMAISMVQRDGAESVAVAERWMAARSSPRFFLFLHLYEPHKPYTPPARYSGYAAYDGEIAYADELVGRFVQWLRDRGLYDEATIVLVSDHGEGLGDHGELEHGVFLYDEALHVPLIIKAPRGPKGRRVADPVQHIDLVPTVLDLLNVPRPTGLRGRSLKPLLDGTGSIGEQGIYSESLHPRYHFGWSELYALTDSRYRLIRAPRDELYDLRGDPGERRNLAADRPQTRVAMTSALDQLLRGTSIDAPSKVSSEDRQRLQALGYVGGQVDLPASASGASLPDPKDKVGVLERYRRAVELAGQRQFLAAIPILRGIVDENPTMADVWQQLGNLLLRTGQPEAAVQAYKRFVALKPTEPNGLVSVAGVLFTMKRLDEAEANAKLALRLASTVEPRTAASAHELLIKIAIARNDAAAARREAELARKDDPETPLAAYVEGRLLHKDGRFTEALAYFAQAARESKSRTLQISDLHYYTADTLANLNRNAEAEAEFRRELQISPQNPRAYAGLAMLYRSAGHDPEAEHAVAELLRAVPTPEGYALAARLWAIFGEPARADAVRAQARAQFGGKLGAAR